MPDSSPTPEKPAPRKPQHISIPKGQHDLLTDLLNKRNAITEQIEAVYTAVLAGSPVKPKQDAVFIGTGTLPARFGKVNHVLVFT